MFRKYNLAIHVNENVTFQNDALLKQFGCSVSEPSNWVAYGSTLERGLTFLDKNGKELNSIVFAHQPFFNPMEEKDVSEKDEIRELICQAVIKNYDISPNDMTIDVTEADAF
jgi:hypothetical protein